MSDDYDRIAAGALEALRKKRDSLIRCAVEARSMQESGYDPDDMQRFVDKIADLAQEAGP